jgi:hypothetical protein
MSQLNLFEAEKPIPAPAPPNPDFIRKHLNRVLRILHDAQTIPWRTSEMESWSKRFPILAADLPPEEGQALVDEFEAQLQRLRAS